MSEHGPRSGPVADDAADEADTEGPAIEMSPVPFDVTPGHDDEDDVPAPRRSRTRTIVLTSLLVVGLAGAAVVGTAGYRIASQKDATVTAPPEAGGLRRDDSEQAMNTADSLRSALTAEVELNESVGAVYTDPASPDRTVLFFGGTALFFTPGDDLDTAFGMFTDNTGAVTGLADVPAGPLGGTMKCGTVPATDGEFAVCGWADHGSLAFGMFPSRTVPESAELLVAIRNSAQTRD